MDENYNIKEISDVTPELSNIPETNPETSVPEHHSYGVNEVDDISEFQDYSVAPKKKSSHHSLIMRSNRNRLGRLLSAVSTVAVPAAAILIIASTAITADVISYDAGADYLNFEFKLSGDKDIDFTAVLSLDGHDKHEIEAFVLDPEYPFAEFRGLEPGRIYRLEVIAAGETRLSLTYKTADGEAGGIRFFEEERVSRYDRISVVLRLEGADEVPNGLRAFVDGTEAELTVNGGVVIVNAHGLEPERKYEIDITDADGNLLYTGMAETVARRHASLEISTFLYGMNDAEIVLNVDNPDENELTAEFDGESFIPTVEDGKIRLNYTELEEGSDHRLAVYDFDDEPIFELFFETREREGATASVDEETVSFDSARIVYKIVNPDNNRITVKYDGAEIDADLSSGAFVLERTGLVMGENHTVEFIDQDGSLFFTHTFAAHVRHAAAIQLIYAEGKFDVPFGSNTSEHKTFCIRATYTYLNQDGNDIKVTINGKEYTAYYNDGVATLAADNLEPSTDYEIVFTDYDGSLLTAHTVRTPDRIKAEADILNSLIKINEISYSFLFNNPHENLISIELSEQSRNLGATMSVSTLTSQNGNVTLSNLRPDTVYSFTIRDDSFGEDIRMVNFTTPKAFTVTQNSAGDAVITLTDQFLAVYTGASVTVTDSLGVRIPVTASQNSTVFTAKAGDLIYADSYTVSVSAGGQTISSAVSKLSGKTRPAFSLRYETSKAATLAEAAANGASYIGESGYFIKYNKTGYYPEQSMAADGSELDFFALVIRNSSGKAITCAIEGFTDANFTYQNTEEERLWMEMTEGGVPNGSYKAGIYLMSGHTREEIERLMWGEQLPQFDKVGELFMKDGRLLSEASFSVSGSKSFAYGYFYTDSVSGGPTSSSVVFTPTVSYYNEGTGYTGYLTVVKASSPTVHQITPISLGTQTDYTQLSPIELNFKEPFYVILYQNSFNTSDYISVTYITP